jgi:hypothetical protein
MTHRHASVRRRRSKLEALRSLPRSIGPSSSSFYLPYLTRCLKHHGGCSVLRVPREQTRCCRGRAPASDFPCFPRIAGYVITVRLWKAMQTCTLLRIVRILPNKNRARSMPSVSVRFAPKGWSQSAASSFVRCAAITCRARTTIEAPRRRR